MSKKLLNKPTECVDDFLDGLTDLHSGLIRLPGHKVILRRDLKNVEGKVAILSGGGAGHEPAHAGFVGRGMLTGAISGSVFTSPPPSSIFAAIQAVNTRNPSGILLIIKNYTGDRLNFGLASEWALNENIKTAMVAVGEDCALKSVDKNAGRRGLAGTVLVHKLAGALAEKGESLQTIVKVLYDVLQNLGTIGICLQPCILPGSNFSSFEIGESEMEIGLGIHGEAGIRRQKMGSCKEIVTTMLNHMTDVKSSTHLSLTKNDDVVVLMNNLGGTSNLEMGVFSKEVHESLRRRFINVKRSYSGSYMTSLQMAGVSLSILKIPSESSIDFMSLLDMSTDVAAPLLSVRIDSEGNTPKVHDFEVNFKLPPLNDRMTLNTKEANALRRCVVNCCLVLKNNEDTLNEYDRGSGDGDCGTTHTRGANAILKHFEGRNEDFTKPAAVFQQIGAVCSEDMGGSSGAIYSILMTATARHLSSCNELSVATIKEALGQGLVSIQKYGGAHVGDRTMVDVLDPVVNELSYVENKPERDIASAIVKSAKDSIERVMHMTCHAGRASNVNSSLLIHPDPGAYAISIIVNALAQSICTTE